MFVFLSLPKLITVTPSNERTNQINRGTDSAIESKMQMNVFYIYIIIIVQIIQKIVFF